MALRIVYKRVIVMPQEGKRKYKKDETTSEVRKKAKVMEKSRDDWKVKNREGQQALKSLKKRMDETKGSRETWRAKFLEVEEESRVSKEKIADLETELFKERFEKLALQQRIEKINEALKKKH